jgi:hypothetical protein
MLLCAIGNAIARNRDNTAVIVIAPTLRSARLSLH